MFHNQPHIAAFLFLTINRRNAFVKEFIRFYFIHQPFAEHHIFGS